MNKEQELRPCPFCGGGAVLDEFENDHIIGWFGRCLECSASMPYAISKPIAVKQWNRRSSDEQAEVVGWVDWHGGECPVAPDATVEAKLRHGGPTHVARASGLSWKHGNIHGPTMDSDIVSYRVLAFPPAVAAGGVTEARAIVDEMLARDKRNGFLTDWWRIKLDALDAALPTPPSRGEGE